MTAGALRELPCADLVEVVTDSLEGQLGPDDRARFDAHLLACPDCVEYVLQIRRTVGALRGLPAEALDPQVLSALPRRA